VRDVVGEWAELDSAEQELKNVIDRLVERVLGEEIPGSGAAAIAVSNVALLAARSAAAAIWRTRIDWRRTALFYILDALGPPDEPDIVDALWEIAGTDGDDHLRDIARPVYDELMQKRLDEEDM
jgi:hypothetical protein